MKLTPEQEKEIMFLGERISMLIDEEASDWASETMNKEDLNLTDEELMDRHNEYCIALREYLIKTTF